MVTAAGTRPYGRPCRAKSGVPARLRHDARRPCLILSAEFVDAPGRTARSGAPRAGVFARDPNAAYCVPGARVLMCFGMVGCLPAVS